MAVNGISRVKTANQEHRNAESEATVNGALPTTPFIREEETGNGHKEDDDCGYCRREKRGIRGCKTGLFEKKRCVLNTVSGLLRELCVNKEIK